MAGQDGSDPELDAPTGEQLAELRRLRELWAEADPVPPSLIDRVITNLAIADLDDDIELLRLIESATPVGTRSTDAGAVSRFGADGVTMLLHLTGADERRRTLIGWIDPPQQAVVELMTPAGSVEVAADDSGRFEFRASRGDRARIVLTLESGRLATHVMEF